MRSFTEFPTVGAVHFVPELFSGPISVAFIFGWTSAEALRLEGFRFHIDLKTNGASEQEHQQIFATRTSWKSTWFGTMSTEIKRPPTAPKSFIPMRN